MHDSIIVINYMYFRTDMNDIVNLFKEQSKIAQRRKLNSNTAKTGMIQ